MWPRGGSCWLSLWSVSGGPDGCVEGRLARVAPPPVCRVLYPTADRSPRSAGHRVGWLALNKRRDYRFLHLAVSNILQMVHIRYQ